MVRLRLCDAGGRGRGRLVFIFPAGDHGLDVGGWRVRRGAQIDVQDEEQQHHVGGSGVGERHPVELQPQGREPNPAIAEKQQQQAAGPDERIDHQLEPQIRQPLQRVVFAKRLLVIRVMFTDEHAIGVIARHRPQAFRAQVGDVVFPCAGGEVPENGESP